MAKRNAAEIIAGAIVLAAAIGFMGYAVASSGRAGLSGYTLHAKFGAIDGLNVGSDVKMAGVKVGSVTAARLDSHSYQAVVGFTVAGDIKLPTDSSAEITSDGLLGGKYLAIEPGGQQQMIPPGGEVTITQSSISIEQLLGKFIFSMGNLSGAQKQPDGDGKAQQPPQPPAKP